MACLNYNRRAQHSLRRMEQLAIKTARLTGRAQILWEVGDGVYGFGEKNNNNYKEIRIIYG